MNQDIKKLPKWAQDLLARKDREMATLKRETELLATQHPGSNTKVHTRLGLPGTWSLPDNSEVEFYLGNTREQYRQMVTVRIRDGRLEVTGYYQVFRDDFVVTPTSGNAVQIYFAKDQADE